MTQPNERLAHAAHYLLNIVAPQMTAAVQAIGERLSHLDGISAGGERNGSRSDVSNPTERIAMKRYTLTAVREDLRDGILDCCNTIDKLGAMANDALRNAGHIPEQSEQALCRDGQAGLEGVIDWGDPMCCRLPVKGKLCQAHYSKWRRHRTDKGIDTSRDYAA